MTTTRTPRNKQKKSAFRKVSEWLHLWLGLASGLVVFIVCFTGALWVFRYEVSYFTEKYQYVEDRHKPFLPPSVLIRSAENYLTSKGDTGAAVSNVIYGKPNRAVSINLKIGKAGFASIFLDPYTGKIIKDKRLPSATEKFFLFVRAGHRFLWLPQKIGSPIVGSACLIFLVIMITGFIWWYPQKWNRKAREKSFTLKWSANWKRFNIDLHNVLGFYVLIFLFLLTTTGIVFSFHWFRDGMYRTLTWKSPANHTQEPSSDTTLINRQGIVSPIDSVWHQTIAKHNQIGRLLLICPQAHKNPYEAMVFFGDGTIIYNRATYYYDQTTLKPIRSAADDDQPYAQTSVGEKTYRMNFDIHTGQILGLPTKIIAFLACLIGASLPITGLIIWLNKRKKAKPVTMIKRRVQFMAKN